MRGSLDEPPATLLVLPNGWVKVAAALPDICADLRRETLAEAWQAYRERLAERCSARGSCAARSTNRRVTREANTWQVVSGCRMLIRTEEA